MNDSTHRSVMLTEAIEHLALEPGQWVVDATFGSGGHTAALLAAGCKVFAIDWDRAAIAAGEERFATALANSTLILANDTFAHLDQLWHSAKRLSGLTPSGILFDFGTSTLQLMSEQRGFSFTGQGPLDMRMDERRGVTAADLLKALSGRELTQLFQEYGGEEEARRIASAIKIAGDIETTSQLAELITKTKRRPTGKLHPATKVFQALRIAVNTELDEITEALPKALKLLTERGHIVTISFHEGEDRIVKRFFREWEQAGDGQVVTKKPLVPSPEEIDLNPRSRSAKLRVFEKGEV